MGENRRLKNACEAGEQQRGAVDPVAPAAPFAPVVAPVVPVAPIAALTSWVIWFIACDAIVCDVFSASDRALAIIDRVLSRSARSRTSKTRSFSPRA